MVTFLLYDKSEDTHGPPGPRFSPNLETEIEPHFFGLIKSLLDDIVDMGSYMERIDKNYPPYNVILFIHIMHNSNCFEFVMPFEIFYCR